MKTRITHVEAINWNEKGRWAFYVEMEELGKNTLEKRGVGGAPIMSALDIFFDSALALT